MTAHSDEPTTLRRPPGRAPLRLAVGLGLLMCAAAGLAVLSGAGPRTDTPLAGYEVVNRYPHDAQAFCQGLVYADGFLYEGTGQYGASSVRKVELETGRIVKQFPLDRRFFGEGLTLLGDSLYQLTWKSRRAFVFDRETLEYDKTFQYQGEGWGLTDDGRHLIMSDGSSTLRWLDPESFREIRRVTVRDARRRIDQLNELEFVDGEIYANVWHSDMIARIAPDDGRILGWIDLSTLWPLRQRPDREAVLNGIAYDEATGRLFVTGKYWPMLYELRVVERP